MEPYEFVEQLVLYWELLGKEERSKTDEQIIRNIYDNIKGYMISGEDLMDSDIPVNITESDILNRDEDKKDLQRKLEEVRKEIQGNSGLLIDRLNIIIADDSKS